MRAKQNTGLKSSLINHLPGSALYIPTNNHDASIQRRSRSSSPVHPSAPRRVENMRWASCGRFSPTTTQHRYVRQRYPSPRSTTKSTTTQLGIYRTYFSYLNTLPPPEYTQTIVYGRELHAHHGHDGDQTGHDKSDGGRRRNAQPRPAPLVPLASASSASSAVVGA